MNFSPSQYGSNQCRAPFFGDLIYLVQPCTYKASFSPCSGSKLRRHDPHSLSKGRNSPLLQNSGTKHRCCLHRAVGPLKTFDFVFNECGSLPAVCNFLSVHTCFAPIAQNLSSAAPRLTSNDWLRLGSTFHSLHAIAAQVRSFCRPPGTQQSHKLYPMHAQQTSRSTASLLRSTVFGVIFTVPNSRNRAVSYNPR